ncbi:unnamed protein product [Cuscuta campestris]|uniref:Uncharacterized protein n=1 Tax=Cuscuta campestris TaxID=132261 RepID=A0A484NMN9_9ASTE|nr:unnamed protein product [Cuscuta campestris]
MVIPMAARSGAAELGVFLASYSEQRQRTQGSVHHKRSEPLSAEPDSQCKKLSAHFKIVERKEGSGSEEKRRHLRHSPPTTRNPDRKFHQSPDRKNLSQHL